MLCLFFDLNLVQRTEKTRNFSLPKTFVTKKCEEQARLASVHESGAHVKGNVMHHIHMLSLPEHCKHDTILIDDVPKYFLETI